MKRLSLRTIGFVIGVLMAVALVGWVMSRKSEPAAAPPTPSALVTLVSAQQGNVDETVTAYGVVAGSAVASRTISAPRAVIIERVLVGPGQPVAAGAPLMVVANTPASELARRQAADAVVFAQEDLARVQRLFDQHLAANDQLAAAQKILADARATVAAQGAAGFGRGAQTLTSPFAGVVAAVPVQIGQQVTADAPLASLVASGGLVAQLGVEPGLAQRLVPGQRVIIRPVLDPGRALASRVGVVGRALDPSTRLVAVTAPLTGATPPLGAAVEAIVTVASHQGILAPRSSLVFDEKGAHVFVVRAGKAHEAPVTPGSTQGDDQEISGDVHPGDLLVVQGAYQLQDGLAVRTSKP